jgi:tRNA pseudouridine38/39 synthase
VEKYIFDALKRTKLIDSIEECNYSRCGRTDKGVSAFGQVIGATLRSNLPTNAEMIDFDSLDEVHAGQKFRVKMPDGTEKTITEIDYPTHINRSLPKDIRVYSVVSAPIDFHARFQARGRTYRYFFVKKNMDITKMQAAANLLVGQHDFRNFCRIDLTAQTFERTIKYFKVFKCPHNTANNPEDQLYFFEIYGQAFLWHQVRCMVGILFMVGKGKEEPSLISRLLDIKVTPRKPQVYCTFCLSFE